MITEGADARCRRRLAQLLGALLICSAAQGALGTATAQLELQRQDIDAQPLPSLDLPGLPLRHASRALLQSQQSAILNSAFAADLSRPAAANPTTPANPTAGSAPATAGAPITAATAASGCSDAAPAATQSSTCAQILEAGNCGAAATIANNWCQVTCDSCPANTRCTDSPPTVQYTCAQQKAFGACSQAWMTANNWCAATCGRCTPQSSSAALALALDAANASPGGQTPATTAAYATSAFASSLRRPGQAAMPQTPQAVTPQVPLNAIAQAPTAPQTSQTATLRTTPSSPAADSAPQHGSAPVQLADSSATGQLPGPPTDIATPAAAYAGSSLLADIRRTAPAAKPTSIANPTTPVPASPQPADTATLPTAVPAAAAVFGIPVVRGSAPADTAPPASSPATPATPAAAAIAGSSFAIAVKGGGAAHVAPAGQSAEVAGLIQLCQLKLLAATSNPHSSLGPQADVNCTDLASYNTSTAAGAYANSAFAKSLQKSPAPDNAPAAPKSSAAAAPAAVPAAPAPAATSNKNLKGKKNGAAAAASPSFQLLIFAAAGALALLLML